MVGKDKFTTFIAISLLFYTLPSMADYHIYLMNNTVDNLVVKNTCDKALVDHSCIASTPDTLQPFYRHKSHVVNYDQGIKHNQTYTQKIFFDLPSQINPTLDNYFSITLKGDLIGSHIVDVSVFISGIKYNLLNDNNDSGKVKKDIVGASKPILRGGHVYTFYADAQADYWTDQGIDSIYLTIDQKPVIMTSRGDNELTVISYNIQAFPNYLGAALDLNKMDSRVSYIGQTDVLRSADVVVFEEAWDHGVRKKLIKSMKFDYPYVIDPIPKDNYLKPLNSGLLVLSRYPVVKDLFVNYQDYQTLVDADNLSNKGALYFKINKHGMHYHLIATHTQAQNDHQALEVRQQQFHLIKDHIINESTLHIPPEEPLLLVGDLNTNFYDQKQFDYMAEVLTINSDVILMNLFKYPKYSYDSSINLMIDPSDKERGLYDYIVPIGGYLQPVKALSQITPIRAVDDNKMYRKSKNIKLYHHGDIELSDHFMLQAKFVFPDSEPTG